MANFQLMAKPSGSVCNIDCAYCFYLEKQHLYPERKSRWKMDGATLENYVRQNINGQQADVVDFAWQGGEPTLLGIDFFREALRLQHQYRGSKRIGSGYMQFIPLVERRAAHPDAHGLVLIQPDFSGQCGVTDWSVPANAYGRFLNTIFDYWVQNDLGNLFVMNFEQMLAKLAGQLSACVINETCGANLIVEANGDVYSCDQFVYPEHKLGNINQDEVVSLVNSPQNIAFGENKLKNISTDCLRCEVRPVCHGGCPKHRFALSSDGRPNKNYFCDGFKTHLYHVLPRMRSLLILLARKESKKKIRRSMQERFY